MVELSCDLVLLSVVRLVVVVVRLCICSSSISPCLFDKATESSDLSNFTKIQKTFSISKISSEDKQTNLLMKQFVVVEYLTLKKIHHYALMTNEYVHSKIIQ